SGKPAIGSRVSPLLSSLTRGIRPRSSSSASGTLGGTVSANSSRIAASRAGRYGATSSNPLGKIPLANLLPSSRSHFFLPKLSKRFTFKEGMWDTQVAALVSSPTVSGGFLRQHDE